MGCGLGVGDVSCLDSWKVKCIGVMDFGKDVFRRGGEGAFIFKWFVVGYGMVERACVL